MRSIGVIRGPQAVQASRKLKKIILALIKPYCDSTDLVLILNGTNEDISRIGLECSCSNIKNVPVNISTLTQKKRMQTYEKGGVYFISSQVLILDMLKDQGRVRM